MFFSCNNSNKKVILTPQINQEKADTIHPEKKLMKVYCYACHNATTSENDRIAPSMIAIKRRYIFKDTLKDEFICDMKSWVSDPTEKKGKMFVVVMCFGVIQELSCSDKVIDQKAEYIYDNDIENPHGLKNIISKWEKEEVFNKS